MVGVLLALLVTISMAKVGMADIGRSGPPDTLAISAPAADLPSPDAECPPSCACPCICACPSTGAILPTGALCAVEVEAVDESVDTPQSMPAINSPEPLLRPPLV